jgi:hypothetical protein
MKPIGLIGGLTYVSTLEYYRYLNEISNQRLGGNETVEVILHSVNFGQIQKLTEKDDWEEIAVIICDAAKKIENAGAGCLMVRDGTRAIRLGRPDGAPFFVPVCRSAASAGSRCRIATYVTAAPLRFAPFSGTFLGPRRTGFAAP